MLKQPMKRRSFLRCAALSAGALVAGGRNLREAGAIEPLKRNGEAKFKFSLAAYSYRDLLQSKKLSLSDFIRDCAAFQLDATELTSYYFPKTLSNAYLRELQRECFLLGLDISGTAVGNDFCHPEGKVRDEQIQLVKTWADHAAVLGAPVIRIFSGNAKQEMSAAEAHKLAVAGIEECCDYAGQRGVHLALENHGGLTSRVDEMLAIVRDVQSPWFGVNLDSGNFHADDIYGDLAKIAPYALNVQVKVVTSEANGKKSPTNFKRLAEILRNTGYRGYIVLEYEEGGDPRDECPKYLAQLREAFAA